MWREIKKKSLFSTGHFGTVFLMNIRTDFEIVKKRKFRIILLAWE